jgi:hypothetical protein
VNRQLRSKDDDIIKNPGQILYRDQINKVALAVKDIIESMKSPAAIDKVKEKDIQAEERVGKKVIVPEKPDLAEKSETIGKLTSDKPKLDKEKKSGRSQVKSKIIVPGIVIVLAIFIAGFLILNHRGKVKLAEEKVLPEIKHLLDEENEENIVKAFSLTQKIEKYIPGNSEFRKVALYVTGKVTLLSDPPGAEVYIRRYAGNEGEWKKLELLLLIL